MPKRLDETPVRRVTGVVREESSPGTPPGQWQAARPNAKLIAPTDVGAIKYSRRFQRLLKLASAGGLDGYLADLVPALAMNDFTDEQYFPHDVLGVASLTLPQNVGTRTIIFLQGAIRLSLVEEIWLQRVNTAGQIDFFWNTVALGGIIVAGSAMVRDQRSGIGTGTGIATGGAGGNLLNGNNTQAAFVSTAFGSVFSGAAQNPAIIRPKFIMAAFQTQPGGLPGMLTFQPSIDNEGMSVTVFYRLTDE